jgi:hypothetical protein
MTQKNTEGQDLNESLVTSGRTLRIAAGHGLIGKMAGRTGPKAH